MKVSVNLIPYLNSLQKTLKPKKSVFDMKI